MNKYSKIITEFINELETEIQNLKYDNTNLLEYFEDSITKLNELYKKQVLEKTSLEKDYLKLKEDYKNKCIEIEEIKKNIDELKIAIEEFMSF